MLILKSNFQVLLKIRQKQIFTLHRECITDCLDTEIISSKELSKSLVSPNNILL